MRLTFRIFYRPPRPPVEREIDREAAECFTPAEVRAAVERRPHGWAAIIIDRRRGRPWFFDDEGATFRCDPDGPVITRDRWDEFVVVPMP